MSLGSHTHLKPSRPVKHGDAGGGGGPWHPRSAAHTQPHRPALSPGHKPRPRDPSFLFLKKEKLGLCIYELPVFPRPAPSALRPGFGSAGRAMLCPGRARRGPPWLSPLAAAFAPRPSGSPAGKGRLPARGPAGGPRSAPGGGGGAPRGTLGAKPTGEAPGLPGSGGRRDPGAGGRGGDGASARPLGSAGGCGGAGAAARRFCTATLPSFGSGAAGGGHRARGSGRRAPGTAPPGSAAPPLPPDPPVLGALPVPSCPPGTRRPVPGHCSRAGNWRFHGMGEFCSPRPLLPGDPPRAAQAAPAHLKGGGLQARVPTDVSPRPHSRAGGTSSRSRGGGRLSCGGTRTRHPHGASHRAGRRCTPRLHVSL